MDFPQQLSCNVLDQKHEEWDSLFTHYERLRKLFEGGKTMHDSANLFLFRRAMENGDVYNDRVSRFSYINHLGNIEGWYVSALFKDPPSVVLRKKQADGTTTEPLTSGTEVDSLSSFQNDCDGSGKSLLLFWQQDVEPKLLTYRKAFVLFDLPVVATPLPSLKAQKDANALRPHLVAYAPQDVINWQLDERGNYLWLILKLHSFKQDSPQDPKVLYEQWYIFTTNQVAVYQREVPTKENGAFDLLQPDQKYPPNAVATLVFGPKPHALADQNRVPVFAQEVHCNHWIADRVASPAIKLLNIENSYHWALDLSNLAQLVVYTDKELDKVVRGESTLLQLAPGDKAEYLEPSGRSFESSQRCINELREDIYRLAYLVAQGRSSSASASSQSGVSKEADMLPARDVLSALGDQARGGLQTILQCAADSLLLNVAVDVQGLSFLDRSELTELEVIERATTIATINSPSFEREVAKRVVRLALPDANDEVFQVIDGEVDKNPTAGEMQQQQMDQQNAQRLTEAVKLNTTRAFRDVADSDSDSD